MSNAATGIRPVGSGWVSVGLGLWFTAQYLRAWPYPHWSLNVVYALWVLGAVSIWAGWSAMRNENRDLDASSGSARPDKDHLRKFWLEFGLYVVLFIAPLLTQWVELPRLAVVMLLLAGWAASLSLIAAWMRDRHLRITSITRSDDTR